MDFLRKITYQDLIFYFLCLALFIVFLMPFNHYTTLNLVNISSGSKTKYYNDLLTVNLSLFKDRYYILYYSLCISSVVILINKKIFSKLVDYFLNFSRLIQIAIIIFFFFGIVSSCFAVSPSIAFKGVGFTFLQFVNIIFIAWYVGNNQIAVKGLYITIVLSLIFFGGILALQLLLSNFSIYGKLIAGNIQSVLLWLYNCLNPRFLDNYFSWFVPLLLLAWFIDLRPIYKIGSFIALTIVWFVLINHAFRTIFVEYLFILPLLFIYSRKYFKLVLIILITTLICGYLVNIGLKEFLLVPAQAGIASPENFMRSGDSGRLLLWTEAFRVGLEHPLTGVGQWNYIAVTKRPDGYPHNLLLEIWSQWGIPAFMAAIVVIITVVKNLFKRRIYIATNPYYCIFIMMLTAGMIDGMLNAMFKTALGLFGSIFVFGFCVSIVVKPEKQLFQKIVPIVSICGALGIISSVFCIVILPIIFPPMWI